MIFRQSALVVAAHCKDLDTVHPATNVLVLGHTGQASAGIDGYIEV